MRWKWVCGVCTAWMFVVPVCSAQLGLIDAKKLSQTADVQSAYQRALGVEQYAQSWSDPWSYGVSKADVAKTLTASLETLRKTSGGEPSNHELELAVGLVAHFAYNLDVEAAYEPAVEFLTKALQGEPGDVRGDWFLGIHECQSLHGVAGMNWLLAVEASGKSVPANFWDDYIACANVALMPGHALRAIDRAVELGRPREAYRNVAEIAEQRYKTADLTKPVAQHDTWVAEKLEGDHVRFTSRLCGVSFVAKGNWELEIPGLSNGTCVASMIPPAKKGQASATVTVMAHVAKDGETLETFALGTLKDLGKGLNELKSGPCPVAECVAFDLVNKSMYSKDGGAHILMTTFERGVPRYDGLVFETPQEPPTAGSGGPVVFRFEPLYRRVPGKVFYVILLDANAQIFEGAKEDWEAVVRSVVVE